MVVHYQDLKRKLNANDLPNHEQQILRAALFMLKELMREKSRDIRRRGREKSEY